MPPKIPPAAVSVRQLSEFDGKSVRQAGVEIPGAAGGLQAAMKVDPQEFRQGERVVVALECIVQKIRHEPIDKDDPHGDQRRVHIFKVDNAAIIEEGIAREALDRQRDSVRRAIEEAEGIARLPYEGDGEDPVEAHNRGDHADELDSECPECLAEMDAERAGD